MKQTLKIKVPHSVTVIMPNGFPEVITCGDKWNINDEEVVVGSIISAGNRVQILNAPIETMENNVNPSDYLIKTYYGLPYFETYKEVEVEVDEPEEQAEATQPEGQE